MSDLPAQPQRNPSWVGTLVRVLLICGGTVAILLPAWLPNSQSVPVDRGVVKLLQASLLAAAAVVMLGAAPHAGGYRPVCRILAIALIAAVVAELQDLLSGVIGRRFPEVWVVGGILAIALITAVRHRRVMVHFVAHLGHHAGSGIVAAALLIIYIFNRVIGGTTFWRVSLGPAFSPNIPKICKSYLELLACYFLFIGALGLSITMARRKSPPAEGDDDADETGAMIPPR